MGDIIFPAVILKRVSPKVSHRDVMAYLKLTIGTDSSLYQFRKPKCKIYHRRGRKSKVIIFGIQLKLDEIKIKFGKNRLLGQDVFIDTVDFGVPRNPDDSDMTHVMLQLHNSLKGGQGLLPCINLFTDAFNQQTGGTVNLECDVLFDECKRNMYIPFLTCPGVLIVDSGSKGRGNVSDRTRKSTEKVPYPYHQIVYKSKLEALQAICFLGGNPKFSRNRRQFVINDKQELSCRPSFHGLDCGGRILDVDGLMKEHGYVPLDKIKQDILDKRKIKAMEQKPCNLCGKSYNILGICSSMSWVAATCSCKLEGSIYRWGDESFFRIGLTGPSRQFFEIKFDKIDPNKIDAPYKLIRGVLPVSKNVQEFRITSWSAYLSHLVFEKKQLHDQQTLGKVEKAVAMEERWVGKHWRSIVKVIIKVTKTQTWSNEGKGKMHRATLIPVMTDDSKHHPFFPFSLEKNHRWMKGTVYTIEDDENNTNVSHVTVLAELPEGRYINDDDYLVVVPKPPVHERNGIQSVLARWNEYEKAKEENKTTIGNVVKVWKIKEMEWCDKTTGREVEMRQVYFVKIETEWTLTWSNLKDRMLDSHLALDITFKRKHTVKHTGRIVGIGTPNDNDPVVAPSTEDERFSIYAVLVLPISFFIPDEQDIVCEECTMKTWMIRPMRLFRPSPLNAIPAGAEFDSRENQEGYYSAFDDGYSTDGSEDGGHEQNMREEERDLYEGVSVYIEDWLEPQFPSDLTFVLGTYGIERPQNDYSLLDLFLTPSSHRDHSPVIKTNIQAKTGLESKFDEIQGGLNPSQKLSVKTIMENKVSSIVGPPGTGKTYTLAMAVASLYCKEEGLMVVCTPSNYAADVVFETLQYVKKEYNLNINTIRMMAQSKENISDTDANYLHVQMRRHLKWRGDPIMDEIIDNEERNGLAGLLHEERQLLRGHKYYISVEILSQVDVVVCTIGCANDQRIANTLRLLEDIDQPLIALFCDESSLVTLPVTIGLLKLKTARFGSLGDDLQLPPVVSDPGALTACLNTTWMQLQRATEYFKNNKMYTMLDEQYRMAEPIARVISGFMYDGKLRSAKPVLERKEKYAANHSMHHTFPELATSHIGVYTYEGFEEKSDGTSWNNELEVAITKNVLWRLANAKANLKDVAVIAMYDSQKKLLQEMLDTMPIQFKEVTLATCDSFQGKENRIVIVNLVKSNPQHNIGFMRDSRRLNVALSRAQDYLMIIGHIPTFGLCKIPDIQKLISLLSLENVQITIMKRVAYGVGKQYITHLNRYMKLNDIQQYCFKKKA